MLQTISNVYLNIRGNCGAITSHHCNEVGDYDTPPVVKKGTRPLLEAGGIYTSLYYAICMFGVIEAISFIDKEMVLVFLTQLNILISIFLVFTFSPVGSRNKPLSKNERTSFKRKSRIITL